MFFIQALFCLVLASCNVMGAYEQYHNNLFQAHVSCNAPYNQYERSKPTIRLNYGGYA